MEESGNIASNSGSNRPKFTLTQLRKMTVAQLKIHLSELGLDTEGKREFLHERLRSALYQDGTISSPTQGNESQKLEFQKTGPVLKRIPKGSRPKVAKALTQILEDIVNKNDITSWQKLFLFARSCLGGTKRGGKKNKSLATIINKRLLDFMSSDGNQSSEPPAKPVKPKKQKPGKKSSISQRVAAKLSTGDVSGAVNIISSSDSVLPPSPEVVKELQKKHPSKPNDSSMPSASDKTDLMFGRDDIKIAITSFKPGSAGGPDGLNPQHLKDISADVLGDPALKLIDALVDFFNKIVLCGKVPDEVCPVFYGANLTALSKPGGGIRPIAVGFTLRRLIGKILSKKLLSKSETLFQPYQVGVGTPKGAEAAVHAVRAFVTSPTNKNKVLPKIDFQNAFNQVRRDVMLKLVESDTPEIYPFVYQCYSKDSNLFFGNAENNYVITSAEGVQQGDPLGPFLFSLTINNLIRSCQSELNLWYLDDGTLASDTETVLADYKKILDAGESLGLNVNPSKCELCLLDPQSEDCSNALERFCNLTEGVKLVSKEQLTLLDSSILPEGIVTMLEPKLQKLKLMAQRLSEIEKHDGLFLLKNCFAIPKLTYSLRTAPCFTESNILSSYDLVIKEALENILNTSLSEDSSWRQCTLPVKQGGLGVRLASEVALPAYLSSVRASQGVTFSLLQQEIQQEQNLFFDRGCDEWKAMLGVTELPTKPIFQSAWDKPLCQKRLDDLINSAPTECERARLLAVSSEGASAFLNALPLASCGLKMSNIEVPVVCALRIGSTLCHPHKCFCGKDVESNGRHGLSCAQQVGRFPRHTESNYLIKRALAQINFPSVLEPSNLIGVEGLVPDGVTIFPYQHGKCLAWDYTCVDSLCDTYVLDSAREPCKAAKIAESKKKNKYKDLENNYEFVPIAVETFGSWGPGSLKFIKEIGKRIQENTGEKRATQYLIQSLSMTIQRGNAASILGTVGPTSKLDEIYDLVTPLKSKD